MLVLGGCWSPLYGAAPGPAGAMIPNSIAARSKDVPLPIGFQVTLEEEKECLCCHPCGQQKGAGRHSQHDERPEAWKETLRHLLPIASKSDLACRKKYRFRPQQLSHVHSSKEGRKSGISNGRFKRSGTFSA